MKEQDKFYLDGLSDEALNNIIEMADLEFSQYVRQLILKFYPDATELQQQNLKLAYKSSFELEKIMRQHANIYAGFTPVYSKTGIIVEIVNDLYHFRPEKQILN